MLLLTDDSQDRGCCRQGKSSDGVPYQAGRAQRYTEGTAGMSPPPAKACRAVTAGACGGICQALSGCHRIPECPRLSEFPYIPGGGLVTLHRVTADVGAVLYPALWVTFTLRDILSIVRALGAEKGLFYTQAAQRS